MKLIVVVAIVMGGCVASSDELSSTSQDITACVKACRKDPDTGIGKCRAAFKACKAAAGNDATALAACQGARRACVKVRRDCVASCNSSTDSAPREVVDDDSVFGETSVDDAVDCELAE
jgi:hypothetical protein